MPRYHIFYYIGNDMCPIDYGYLDTPPRIGEAIILVGLRYRVTEVVWDLDDALPAIFVYVIPIAAVAIPDPPEPGNA